MSTSDVYWVNRARQLIEAQQLLFPGMKPRKGEAERKIKRRGVNLGKAYKITLETFDKAIAVFEKAKKAGLPYVDATRTNARNDRSRFYQRALRGIPNRRWAQLSKLHLKDFVDASDPDDYKQVLGSVTAGLEQAIEYEIEAEKVQKKLDAVLAKQAKAKARRERIPKLPKGWTVTPSKNYRIYTSPSGKVRVQDTIKPGKTRYQVLYREGGRWLESAETGSIKAALEAAQADERTLSNDAQTSVEKPPTRDGSMTLDVVAEEAPKHGWQRVSRMVFADKAEQNSLTVLKRGGGYYVEWGPYYSPHDRFSRQAEPGSAHLLHGKGGARKMTEAEAAERVLRWIREHPSAAPKRAPVTKVEPTPLQSRPKQKQKPRWQRVLRAPTRKKLLRAAAEAGVEPEELFEPADQHRFDHGGSWDKAFAYATRYLQRQRARK